MRALLLLIFTLLAGSAAAQDSASLSNCKEGQADCREECTVEYGGSTRTYDKLGACLQKCKQKYDKCRENQLKIQKDELDPGPESPPTSGTGKPAEQSASSKDGGAATDGGTATDGGAGRDGGASTGPGLDGGVPATSDPAMDTSELDQLYDEQLPPPPSAKPQTKSKTKSKAKAEPPPTEPQPDP